MMKKHRTIKLREDLHKALVENVTVDAAAEALGMKKNVFYAQFAATLKIKNKNERARYLQEQEEIWSVEYDDLFGQYRYSEDTVGPCPYRYAQYEKEKVVTVTIMSNFE